MYEQCLKKYLKPKHNLLRCFEHYERVLVDCRYEELVANFKMLQTTLVLLLGVEMLRHRVKVYTPEVFKLFEEEYKRILDYNIYKVGKSEMTTEYKVSYIMVNLKSTWLNLKLQQKKSIVVA